MRQNVRENQIQYRQKSQLVRPTGRLKHPVTGKSFPDTSGKKSVLLIHRGNKKLITSRLARHLWKNGLVTRLSSKKPLVLLLKPTSSSRKDDLIIEKYQSALLSRTHREHREELIHQIKKAKTGKPRKAYNEQPAEPLPYVRLPYTFGRELNDRA